MHVNGMFCGTVQYMANFQLDTFLLQVCRLWASKTDNNSNNMTLQGVLLFDCPFINA